MAKITVDIWMQREFLWPLETTVLPRAGDILDLRYSGSRPVQVVAVVLPVDLSNIGSPKRLHDRPIVYVSELRAETIDDAVMQTYAIANRLAKEQLT